MRFVIAALFPLSFSFSEFSYAQLGLEVSSYSEFDLKIQTNIRAIDVVNDSTVWFSGSSGVFGFTNNGGKKWSTDTLKIDTLIPDWRLLSALNDSIVILLNAGSPAFVMKSMDWGRTWKKVYENYSKEIFFDAMKFSNGKNGFALGDPMDGQFQILETHDAGDHWATLKNLPSAFMGEACFASSNSSFDFERNVLWIGTGGSYNRVLSVYDGSRNWSSSTALVQCCGRLKGIFSMDFFDDKIGIVVGGDYDKKQKTDSTACVTYDGGKNWKVVGSGQLPFGSCVQFQPGSHGKTILVACLPGIYFSTDAGINWFKLKDEKGKEIAGSYFTFQFSPSGKTAWFAGANGHIARIELK